MDEKKNINPEIRKHSEKPRTESAAPIPDYLQFNPNFDDQHANPFLDIPLMEIPDEPEEIQAPRKRSVMPVISGIVFYLLIFLGIFLFWQNTQNKLDDLDQQLEHYELSQAPHFAQTLFDEHFSSPNWGALYDAASSKMPTQYEGRSSYIRYMNSKVGDQPLTYRHRKDLSENEIQYDVYLQKERIASFTMVNSSSDPVSPDWKFGSVNIFYTNDQSYRIECAIGHTVKVNGVPLNESSIVKSTQFLPTNALKMLVSQFPVIGVNTYEIQDLMSTPLVSIEDAQGNPLKVSYLEEGHIFSESFNLNAVPLEVQDLAINAMHTYCSFMLQQAGAADISMYFKSGTDAHKIISNTRRDRIQKPESFSFAEEKVSNLVYYSSDFYSVDVALAVQMVRSDGTIKKDLVEKSLFFRLQDNGSWLCTNLTSEKLYDEATSVRVKFVQDDEVLFSRMINQKEEILYCPDPVVPTELPDNSPAHIIKKEDPSQLEKIVFAGWGLKLMDQTGRPYYQPVFQVGLDRKAEVPGGLLEDPITLYPIFVWEEI